jgi:hypothetical protein
MTTKKNTSKKVTAKKSAKESGTAVGNLLIADGKTDIEKIKSLEDLLGVKQANPFQTTSGTILEEKMQEMTLTDLQSFAIRVGILPSGNKLSLKNKITRAFKSHAGAGAGYNIAYHRPLVDPSSKEAEDILRISNEGL